MHGGSVWEEGVWRYVKSFTDAVELGSFCIPIRPGFAYHPVLKPVPELGSLDVSDCQIMWLSLGPWSSTGDDFVHQGTCGSV